MNEIQKNIDDTVKEWAVVRYPCTDGIDRLGMEYECDAPKNRIVCGNLTYNEADVQCHVKSKELNVPVYDGCDGDIDIAWNKIEY